jgi:hypothetical protein
VQAPAIKATAFQSVVDDVQRLLDEGRLSRERLEASLEAADLAILEEKQGPTAWIPIGTYERVVELLARVEARGEREAYLVRRGERSAERLAALGIYSQLDATAENLGTRVGRMIVTVSGAIYSFGSWHFEVGEAYGEFTIRVEEASAMPEAARFATQGFVQAVATRVARTPRRIASERPRADLVLFRTAPSSRAEPEDRNPPPDA